MRYLISLSIFLMTVFIPKVSCGETSVENVTAPNMSWETVIQDSNLEYELKRAGVSPDGSHVYFVSGSRPKGRTSGHQDIKLHSVDVAGKLQTSIDLNSYIQQTDSPESGVNVGGMAISETGIVYLALTQATGQIRYVGADVKTKQVLVNRMIAFDFPVSLAYKMLLTKSGTLLLVGDTGKKGFIAEINKSGGILWQSKIDSPVNVLLDVIEVENGFAIVGGIVDKSPSFLFKEIWAGRVSSKGELLKSLTLPGPAGFSASIAQASNGQFVIGYDRLGGAESEISQVVGQGLNRDFLPIWNKMLSSANKGNSQVVVQSAMAGGYIVAVVNRNLWVSRLQDDGAVSWTHSTKVIAPDYPMFNGVNLLRAGQDFVLASGLSVVNDRTQQQIVKVTKFPVK